MYYENKKIEFDEEVEIIQSPDCCWRCNSSDTGVEDTALELDSVVVDFVCNDCSVTWQVKYEPTTLFIAIQ